MSTFVKKMIVFLVWLVGALVAAMHAVGDASAFESDGDAVNVSLLYTVTSKQILVVDGWVGVAGSDGDSGDTIALDIAEREFQVQIPTGLAVAIGDTVYIDTADLTGHVPDSTAYATSGGSGLIAAFKATSAHYTYNSLRYFTGILITKTSLIAS